MSSTPLVLLDRPEPLADLLAGVVIDPEERLVGQIQRVLAELIIGVRLRPGQLVSEKEISECLGASKTPVREALIRLEDAGLVTVIPKSGTYVTPVRISTYLEACFTRLQLEIGAVRRAAERHEDTAFCEELEEILGRQGEALESKDDEQFFLLDEALHQAFFRMAGVPGVWATLKRTQVDVLRIRHLKRLHGVRRVSGVLADHRRIVEAISAGGADAAESALVGHIGSLDSELEKLAKHPGLMAFIEAQALPGGRSRLPSATANRPS